ncbi:nucleotide exchange factor GrpE, partial [Methanosarcinales archaeon]
MRRYIGRHGGKVLSKKLSAVDEEMLEIEEKLEATEKKMEEYIEDVKRLQAEFENYRKRVEREKEEFVRYANEKLILKLIDVCENLERGLENCGEGDGTELVKGVRMIHRQVLDILSDAGVKRIKAEGKQFDHNMHEAVMQTETDEVPEDTVLEELQRGYLLHGKVLCHSKVRIAKEPE